MNSQKAAISLLLILAATACEISPNKIIPVGVNPSSSDAEKEDLRSRGTPSTEPTTLRAATLREILSAAEKAAPSLVDATGAAADKAPGLIVGVVTEAGSQVIGFGTTRVEGGHKPNGETYFGIGSVTKVFTGLVLAEAVSKGGVTLEDSANKYLPSDIALPVNAITLRQLATHTSGLPNYPANLKDFRDNDNDGVPDSDASSPGRNYWQENLSSWLQKKPSLKFKPGQSTLYSNLGSGMLSLVLQAKMNHSSFDVMMSEHITKPLGMKRTQANTPEMQGENLDNKAQGYAAGAELIPMPFADMGVLDGAGELVSTANDMNKFMQGLAGISKTPLADSFSEANRSLSTQGKYEMAYSSAIEKSAKGGTYYLKPGNTPGYSAIILWRTNPKVGIVVLSNRGGLDKVNELGKELIELAVK